MCGITAIFAYKSKAPPVDRTELTRLKESMTKRGPDGSGEWYSEDGRLGLAHTRLSIIDLNTRAAQPMRSSDGQAVITYNGEIYNHKELRRQLSEKGYTFSTTSDTEVLLNLYREYGQDMLHCLRGMFAFAIWDAETSTLFCARDPYGIKPLYYSDCGATLRIASQVKTLVSGNIDSNENDPAGVAGFYLFGHVPEPFTLYKAIHALPAGHLLRLRREQQPEIVRYAGVARVYNEAEPRDPNRNSDISEIRKSLRESVACHMVSDVPVGIFLSAGIDSCVLLSLMSEQSEREIQAITLGFDEYRGRSDDEVPISELVANQYGARHEVISTSESDVKASLPDFLHAMDQPSIDGLNTWLVSRAARQCGLKVAISGLGGDELFGGYPSFRDIPKWRSAFASSQRIPGLNTCLGWSVAQLRRLGVPLNPKAAALPRIGGSWAGAYLARRGLFMPWELEDLMGREFSEAGLAKLNPLELIDSEMTPDPGMDFTRVAAMESGLYMKNQLLRDADWASMDHSLEVRTPLVDYSLMKALAPLVKSNARGMSKKLLAKVPSRSMPPAWSNRDKTGFTVPIARWLESVAELGVWKNIPSLRRAECHWSRRWAFTIMSTATGVV